MECENNENVPMNYNPPIQQNGGLFGSGKGNEFPCSNPFPLNFSQNQVYNQNPGNFLFGNQQSPQNHNFFPTNTPNLFGNQTNSPANQFFGGNSGFTGQYQPNNPFMAKEIEEDVDEEYNPNEEMEESDFELPNDLEKEDDCLHDEDNFDLQHYLSVRNQL